MPRKASALAVRGRQWLYGVARLIWLAVGGGSLASPDGGVI
jgi:hypothetical protein